MLKSFDVSNNNGIVDWAQINASEYPLCSIKGLEGASLIDSQFARNYAEAKKRGIYRVAYNFAHPKTSSATMEAQAFYKLVMANGGFELPPCLDFEDNGGMNPRDVRVFAEVWAKNMIQLTGFDKCILYADSSFIRENGLGALSHLFYLWLADYIQTGPPNLGGWPTPEIMWQRTDKGHVPGINGDVDIDYFMGTMEQLKALMKGGTKMTTTTYKTMKVMVNGAEFNAIGVPIGKTDVTYVDVAALDKLGTKYSKVNTQGEYLIGGTYVKGIVQGGIDFVPWYTLALPAHIDDKLVSGQWEFSYSPPAPTPVSTSNPATSVSKIAVTVTNSDGSTQSFDSAQANTPKPLGSFKGLVANDALIVTVPGIAAHMQFDTGAFELLLSGPIGTALNLPNLGPQNVGGIGGQNTAYKSEIDIQIGDKVYPKQPCVVDPSYSEWNDGLFGLKFLNDNKIKFNIDLESSTPVTFYE